MNLFCKSIEQFDYKLNSSYFNYTNGGAGLGHVCDILCANDLKCKYWMLDYMGNTCYLSNNIDIIHKSENTDNNFVSFLLDRSTCYLVETDKQEEQDEPDELQNTYNDMYNSERNKTNINDFK